MDIIRDIQSQVDKASAGFSLSLENILQVGFNYFRKSPGIFIIYSIVAAIAISNPVTGILFGGPMLAGYYIYILHLRNRKDPGLPVFFRSFDKFFPLMVLNLLLVLIITLGLIMLVIPGIYFMVSYLFAHFFVWFFDIHPSEALRLSRKMVSGNFSQLFWLCLILAGINLLGAMAFLVGLLLTIPFTACVIFAAFEDIIGIP